MTAVSHLWLELTFMKIKHSRSQVLSKAITRIQEESVIYAQYPGPFELPSVMLSGGETYILSRKELGENDT